MEKPVSINQTIALLMLIGNIIYLASSLAVFTIGRLQPVADAKHIWTAASVNSGTFQMGAAFFYDVIYAGLLWLLVAFREKRWLRSGIISLFALSFVIFLVQC